MTTEAATAPAAAPATMGDAAAGSAASTGAEASVPLSVNTETKTDGPTFKDMLGDYAKEAMFEPFLNDPTALAKAYADTKRLVGQKLGIPDEKASDEAKAAFYKSLGVPDKIEEYGLQMPEGVPEGLQSYYKDNYLPSLLKVGKELNLTKAQLAGLQKWSDTDLMETVKGLQEDTSKSDEEFAKITKEMFGDETEKKLERAGALLREFLPEALQKDLSENMTSSGLAAIVAVIDGYIKKNGISENKDIGGGGDAPKALSADAARKEAKQLMATKAYNDPFDPEHKNVKARVDGLYARM